MFNEIPNFSKIVGIKSICLTCCVISFVSLNVLVYFYSNKFKLEKEKYELEKTLLSADNFNLEDYKISQLNKKLIKTIAKLEDEEKIWINIQTKI